MDCSPPGSSVHEILWARILEWVAIPFSRGSSQPRDQTRVFIFPHCRQIHYHMSHQGGPTPSKINHCDTQYQNIKYKNIVCCKPCCLTTQQPFCFYSLLTEHLVLFWRTRPIPIPNFRVNPDLCNSIMVNAWTVLSSGVGQI